MTDGMKQELIDLGIRPEIAEQFCEMVKLRMKNTGETANEAGKHITKYLMRSE